MASNPAPAPEGHDASPAPRPTKKPRRWTEEEDRQLRAAVADIGERNWKSIASRVAGRSHVQCLQRWQQVLRPGLRKGHWAADEDDRLLRAVREGVSNWAQVAHVVGGRSAKQCRERWINHLSVRLRRAQWTTAQEQLLFDLGSRFPGQWAAIAKEFPGKSEAAVRAQWEALFAVDRRPRDPDLLRLSGLADAGFALHEPEGARAGEGHAEGLRERALACALGGLGAHGHRLPGKLDLMTLAGRLPSGLHTSQRPSPFNPLQRASAELAAPIGSYGGGFLPAMYPAMQQTAQTNSRADSLATSLAALSNSPPSDPMLLGTDPMLLGSDALRLGSDAMLLGNDPMLLSNLVLLEKQRALLSRSTKQCLEQQLVQNAVALQQVTQPSLFQTHGESFRRNHPIQLAQHQDQQTLLALVRNRSSNASMMAQSHLPSSPNRQKRNRAIFEMGPEESENATVYPKHKLNKSDEMVSVEKTSSNNPPKDDGDIPNASNRRRDDEDDDGSNGLGGPQYGSWKVGSSNRNYCDTRTSAEHKHGKTSETTSQHSKSESYCKHKREVKHSQSLNAPAKTSEDILSSFGMLDFSNFPPSIHNHVSVLLSKKKYLGDAISEKLAFTLPNITGSVLRQECS